MDTVERKDSTYVPQPGKEAVPFMRDVFTIPKNAREKPKLIGSVCRECEEYFFPKTGSKPTCDNPFCPRSTSEVLLSGRGKLLSATVTRPSSEGEEGRVSAVILLEEGIKINSHLVGWEGYRDLLVPGTPVELVLQEMGQDEAGRAVVGYAFRLVTGRRKPVFPEADSEDRQPPVVSASRVRAGEVQEGAAKEPAGKTSEAPVAGKAAPKATPKPKVTLEEKSEAKPKKKVTAKKKVAAKKKAAKKKPAAKKKKAPARKSPKQAPKKTVKKPASKVPKKKAAVKKRTSPKARSKTVKKGTKAKPTQKRTAKKKTVKKIVAKKPAKKTTKKKTSRTPKKKRR